MTLFFDEPTFARPVTERLILQRTFSAFIANRAIKRMICEQQLKHTFLRFFDGVSRGANNLSFGNWRHARHNHHWSAGCFNFNKTLSTHADRTHARVVTKSWDEIIRAIGSGDDHLAFAGQDRFVVDSDVYNIRINNYFFWINNRHECTPLDETVAIDATAVTGIVTRLVTRDSNSLLNKVNAECTGAKAEGPTKQIVVIL